MKKIALLILLIAYLPMFFLCKSCELRGLYDSIYGTLSVFGISLMFLAEFKEKKDWFFVPIASLFSVIGIIFILDLLFDSFYHTYKPVLLIILFVLLCYALLFIRLRNKST